MISLIVIITIIVLACGYLIYGRFLSRQIALDDSKPTPACAINDGVDFVPAKPALLLGQHFSAIAAAGPVVGPILAAVWFGWLPALLWILLGAVFIGGVHDFTTLVASVRHKAASIAQIVKEHMSKTSHVLFLIFMWLSLVYVIIAFTDITAHTFKTVAAGTAFGPGVAGTSVLYILASMTMGILMFRFKLKLLHLTLVFLPLVLFLVWLGPHLPPPVLAALSSFSVKEWDVALLIYCGIASIIPMWLLLQPRGYLGGWLLYITILVGLVGALAGGFTIQYPALHLEGLKSMVNGKMLFPILFITVACGACSGFHGIVSSGTTSKQICRETDTRLVGYGAMLLEALVAVLALATVAMLPPGSDMLKSDPNLIYANGLAKYLGTIGVGFSIAFPFALLAFSTFVYDTLDVATRLGRYIFEEIFGLKSRFGSVLATLATLALPLLFLLSTKEKGYLVAWPIFGTSNQLLASLSLLAISVWLIKSGKKALFAIIPMLFMMIFTLWSLILQIMPFIQTVTQLDSAAPVKPDTIISGLFGIILLVMSLWLIWEMFGTLVLKKEVGGIRKDK